ncbi:MAG: GNAT family N-acetyltransferase, partial [Oscillospiraceae bacterium]|nr:GNAT family N-acetyltransferase [Oscillospiraceae bacterium]
VDDFYYLEALETSPKQRKMGYGARVLSETIDLLKQRGSLTIRDNVKKDNLASLATHRRCGFRIEQEEAVNCLSGETRADYYGLIYQES